MALWCLEVVPVVYARVFMYGASDIFKSSLNDAIRMHSWPPGIASCDESKHDEVAFQLAAADLNSYGLKSLRQTSHFKR